jgi:hypothetical protein
MTHDQRCTCGECHKLDRKHPAEGFQLNMFDQREQRPPTAAEALASLFLLAGKGAADDHGGQRRMVL